MPQKDDENCRRSPRAEGAADARKARLAEQLRANLQRRKAQARSRRAGEADQRPEGLAPADPGNGEQAAGARRAFAIKFIDRRRPPG